MHRLALTLLLLSATTAAESQLRTLWNCREPSGRTILTDIKEDTVGKDCRVVHEERVVLPKPQELRAFRATIKPGVRTAQGLVVEVKAPIALIQQATAQRWIRIDELLPPR